MQLTDQFNAIMDVNMRMITLTGCIGIMITFNQGTHYCLGVVSQ
jgi:hypothetical protein